MVKFCFEYQICLDVVFGQRNNIETAASLAPCARLGHCAFTYLFVMRPVPSSITPDNGSFFTN
jgi:hypothetical protein